MMIVGNWKMYGTQAEARALAEQLTFDDAIRTADADGVRIVVCPPFTALTPVHQIIASTTIALGAQACHHQLHGAYTGDVSAAMLRDVGCKYVLVGHSERRRDHHETDDKVASIAIAALDAGLIPIVCIGETYDEHQIGRTQEVLQRQLDVVCVALGTKIQGCIIAYEPVWAIGTGLAATIEHVGAVHAYIADRLAMYGASVPILYGGSVNTTNARELVSCSDVHGLLVGGASLNAPAFSTIVATARRTGGDDR